MTTGNYRGSNGALITTNGQGHGSESPEQIEREIEETRARMEQTIAAIRHDLSPGQLVDQALHAFRSGKVGDYAKRAGSSFGDVVKENPVPVALIGIGLTWLAVSSSSSSRGASVVRVESPESSAEGMKDRIEGSVAETRGKVSERAHAATDTVKAKASEWKGRASGMAHSASDRARMTSQQARERARRARDSSSRAYQENPLLMGVAAIGIGALVGALFPSTPQEGRLLGEKRDRLLRKADETAGRAIHKVTEQVHERGVSTMSPGSSPSGIDTGPAADVYGDEDLKR